MRTRAVLGGIAVALVALGPAAAHATTTEGASLTGEVYLDLDGDGTRDSGEPGRADVQLTLRTDAAILDATVTASDGTWTFNNVAAGTVTLVVEPPNDLDITGSTVAGLDTSSGEATVEVADDAALGAIGLGSPLTTGADVAATVTLDEAGSTDDSYRWELRALNLGADAADGPVDLRAVLSAGHEVVDAAGAGWTCETSTAIVLCSAMTDLPPGSVLPTLSLTTAPVGDVGTVVTVTGTIRLDPTVRGLLRAFLSPAVADRYTSALQPIAVADRDAALAGAVSTLRSRFYVPPDEIAVVLVEDAGWSVADVSTMLGMPLPAVRAALRTAVTEEPRVGGAAPPEDDEIDDEAAAVEAMLGGLPRHRRDAGRAAEEDAGDEPVDVELATTLPAAFGRAELAARTARADRLQRRVVNGIIIGLVVVVGLVLATTTAPPAEVTDEDEVTVEPSPSPTPSATPTTDDGTDEATDGDTDVDSTDDADGSGDGADVPVGDPVLAEVRFVASVDPTTGTPGPALDPATTDDDPRLWLRFSQLPADDPVILLTFTAPSGRSTVRPVLLSDRTPLAAVRLPDELGRAPGRYAVVVEAEGLPPVVEELELVAAPSDDDA